MKTLPLIVAAALQLAALSCFATITGVSLGPLGTASTEGGNRPALNDESGATQTDTTGAAVSWAMVKWPSTPQPFDKLIIEFTPGWVVAGFDIQVAVAAASDPDGSNDADWETIAGGSFSGVANNGQPVYAFDVSYVRAGVRVRATDKSNIPGGAMRLKEIWVFNNYVDLAPLATITAPGWTGTTVMADEQTQGQNYTSNTALYPDVTLTWGSNQSLGAVLIHGGSGAGSEHLIDFEIQYNPAGTWTTLVSVVGNTAKTYHHVFDPPLTTDDLRLHITAADSYTTYARLAEIWAFAALPNQAPVASCADFAAPALPGCCLTLTADAVDNGSYDPDGAADVADVRLSSPDDIEAPDDPHTVTFCDYEDHLVTLTIEDNGALTSSCDATVSRTPPTTVYDERGGAAGLNVAALGTATTELGPANVLTDQSGASQQDTGTGAVSWAMVKWPGTPTMFNKIILEFTYGWVVAGFDLQVAKAGVADPDGANDADWDTIPGGSFSGLSSTGQIVFPFDVAYTRTGVRVRATDKSNIADNRMRIKELWVFANYDDVAPAASISAPGWTGVGFLADEATQAQNYTSNTGVYPDVTLTWGADQSIGGVLIHGGSGAASEHLIDFQIEARVAGGWTLIDNVVGNTQKTTYHSFVPPVLADGLRLHITAADSYTTYARLAEIWVTPGTMPLTYSHSDANGDPDVDADAVVIEETDGSEGWAHFERVLFGRTAGSFDACVGGSYRLTARGRVAVQPVPVTFRIDGLTQCTATFTSTVWEELSCTVTMTAGSHTFDLLADLQNTTDPSYAFDLERVFLEPLANQPPVAHCQDVAVAADATCTAAASIDLNSSDPDGDLLTLTQTPPGPYAPGVTAVTLLVDDGNGGTDSCSGEVTVTTAGSCSAMTDEVYNAVCTNGGDAYSLALLVALIDQAIIDYLDGGTICDPSVAACREAILAALGLL